LCRSGGVSSVWDWEGFVGTAWETLQGNLFGEVSFQVPKRRGGVFPSGFLFTPPFLLRGGKPDGFLPALLSEAGRPKSLPATV